MSDAAGSIPSVKFQFGDIAQFAVKTCIVAIVISASTIFVANWIMESLETSATRGLRALREEIRAEFQKTPIGGPRFWGKVEQELDRAADPASDLPPDKKQKLVNDVRVITARWRPFVDAVTTEMQKPAP